MKTSLLFLLLVMSGFIKSDRNTPGFIVIELFTSEGCSSCPSAEKLLKRLDQKYTGRQVYVMEFHVDYWDKYGWKDPYSKHEFTERQWAYCDYLKSQTYTPQAVINGREQFVGSDSLKVINSINYFSNQPLLNEPPKYSVSRSGQQVKIQFQPDPKLKGNLIHAALVETRNTSSVTAGENKGRTLQHVNVVRDFATATIGRSAAELQVNIPAADKKDFKLILYTQHPKKLNITSAAQLEIN